MLSPRSSILRPFLAEERTVVLCEACGKSWSSTEKGLQGELEFSRVGIMAAGDMAVLESRLTTKIICINTRITYYNLNHLLTNMACSAKPPEDGRMQHTEVPQATGKTEPTADGTVYPLRSSTQISVQQGAGAGNPGTSQASPCHPRVHPRTQIHC